MPAWQPDAPNKRTPSASQQAAARIQRDLDALRRDIDDREALRNLAVTLREAAADLLKAAESFDRLPPV